MTMPKKDDPRTVKVRHGDTGEEHMVTPEVADALDAQNNAWERVGGPVSDTAKAVERATAPLHARIAELEAQVAELGGNAGDDLPSTAAELIDWIGDDPDRATQAQAAEADRPDPRKTVLEHIESVLNTTSKED